MSAFIFPFEHCTNNELLCLFPSFSNPPTSLNLDITTIINDNLADAFDNSNLPTLTTSFSNNCSYSTTDEISSWPKLPNSFALLNLNSRSLNSNFDKLKLLLSNFMHKPDIITISETWIQENHLLKAYNIENYNFISIPRNNKRGGGVGIYINHLFNYEILYPTSSSSISSTPCELCAVEIYNQNSHNIIIINVYKPPDFNASLFIDFLSEFIDSIKINKKQVLLTGDFNIDLLQYHNNLSANQFVDFVLSVGLLPSIIFQTRISRNSATLIDNIFTNLTTTDQYSRIIFDDISDHLPICYNCNLLKLPEAYSSLSLPTKRIFSATNYNQFLTLIGQIDWHPLLPDHAILNALCPNESYNLFYSKIFSCFDRAFPL
jgi:hypothetical protein